MVWDADTALTCSVVTTLLDLGVLASICLGRFTLLLFLIPIYTTYIARTAGHILHRPELRKYYILFNCIDMSFST